MIDDDETPGVRQLRCTEARICLSGSVMWYVHITGWIMSPVRASQGGR